MESFDFMKKYLEVGTLSLNLQFIVRANSIQITDDLDCLNSERSSQHGDIKDCIRELVQLKEHPATTLYQRAVVCIQLTTCADFTPKTPFIHRHALEVFHLCRQMAENEPQSAQEGALRDVIQDLQVKAARALRDLEQRIHNRLRPLRQYEHWDIRRELRRDFKLSPADCGLEPDEYDEKQYYQGMEGVEGDEGREEQEEEPGEVDVEEDEETATSEWHAGEGCGDAEGMTSLVLYYRKTDLLTVIRISGRISS
jgi:hypothetical protein